MGKAEDSFIAKIIERIVGEVKGKVEDLVSRAKKEIISRLENADEIPRLEMLYTVEGSDKTYLSRSLALELIELLKTYKEKLEPIPEELSEYRQAGLRLIKSLLPLVEDYVRCFDILMNGQISRFSRSKGLNYDKILQARKSMKDSLMGMDKSLKNYTDGGKYTYKSIADDLQNSVTESREHAKQLLAKKFYVTAFNLIKDHIIGDIEVDDPSPGVRKGAKMLSKGVMKYADMLKANEGDASLHADLEEAVKLVEGVRDIDYTKNEPSDFDKNSTSAGARRCLSKAEKVLDDISTKDPFELNGLKAKSPFMGDCMIPVQNIINYTLQNLNTVINLGGKTDKLYDSVTGGLNPNFQSADLGVDLKTLLGDEDYKQWANQQKVLNTAVKRDLAKNRDSIHNKVEKEYKQIQKYKKKYFEEEGVPGVPQKFEEFSKLIVYVPTKDEAKAAVNHKNGLKKYNISEEYNGNLAKFYRNASNLNLADDYILHYIRKAEKFLIACDAWNEKRTEYEEWLKDREKTAETLIKNSKKHHSELRKQINDFYKGKKGQKTELKDLLRYVDGEYKNLKWYKFTFMKDFDKNCESSNKFCGLRFSKNDGKLCDADGHEVQVPAS